MEVLPIGYYFNPTDQDILTYLRYYVAGQPLSCGFSMEYDYINNFQMEQPPDVRMLGSTLERLYCYVNCFYKLESGQIKRERKTSDGKGNWNRTHGEETIHDENGRIAGYKQDFRFCRLEAGGTVSTTWVMTEYTLQPGSSTINEKAVCVLRNTRLLKAGTIQSEPI